ncbi:MAG: alpha/beta fold hydrolase [Acidobacteriota bacterium]
MTTTALVSSLALLIPLTAFAQATQEPPPSAPADWGPMSINLEDVPYPHPVKYFAFTLEGQDVRMAYMDVSPSGTPNGRSVILLHGMNFFGETWTDTIEVLRKEGYRVIPIDQIGYGRSSKPILHYTISTHASNTKRLLDHLAIKTTDIVTHSMGGMVGSRFSALYPDAVGSLAMINQIGLTDTRPGRAVRETTDAYKAGLARDYPEIIKGMRAYYVNWKPEYMKYVKIHYGWTRSGDWPRMAMVRALQQQAVANDPVVYDWPHIKARTLVIGGEKDGPNYPALAKRVADTVQNGQVYIIPNIGHNPQFEAPELLYPPLVKFLKGGDVGTKKAATSSQQR